MEPSEAVQILLNSNQPDSGLDNYGCVVSAGPTYPLDIPAGTTDSELERMYPTFRKCRVCTLYFDSVIDRGEPDWDLCDECNPNWLFCECRECGQMITPTPEGIAPKHLRSDRTECVGSGDRVR